MFAIRQRVSGQRWIDGLRKSFLFRGMALTLCAVVLSAAAFPVSVFAEEKERQTVRVGYYEKEGFEETAPEGEARRGYAYEYYLRLAGWHNIPAGSMSMCTAVSPISMKNWQREISTLWRA